MARRNLHVRLSEHSYDSWREFATLYSVSVTALIEAMGERLGEIIDQTGLPITGPGIEILDRAREIVTRAREIDQAHRSRRSET